MKVAKKSKQNQQSCRISVIEKVSVEVSQSIPCPDLPQRLLKIYEIALQRSKENSQKEREL